MIMELNTNINKEHLVGLSTRIDNVCPLNRFDDKPHWSLDLINADKVYRIQKFVQRVVEETGVLIHSQVIDLFQPKNKIFPYNMQLIKIDKNIFNTDIVIQEQICQTITPLTEDCKTYVLYNNSGNVEVKNLKNNDYAIATYWTEFKDPYYKPWFIGKYLERYG